MYRKAKRFKTSKTLPARRLQSGITMMEVLVTVFVTAVGLLGIAAMQSSSMKSSLDSAQRVAAASLAYEITSRLRANPNGARSGDYVNAFGNNAICDAPPPVMCSDHYNQQTGNVVTVGACTATQVANFDAWEISCGYQNEDDSFSSPVNYLVNPDIDLTCVDSDAGDADACSVNSQYTISLTWDAVSPGARNANQDPNQPNNNEITELNLTVTPFI